MDFVQLIVTVCSLSAPDTCEERAIPFMNETSVMQCVFDAPLFLAQWKQGHPNLSIARWRCSRPSIEGEKT